MSSFVCQALLFDLDGVLVDSTACVSRIWAAWARKHGLDPDYVVHVTHGQRTVETVAKVAPHLDAQHEADEIVAVELGDTQGLRVLPGAKALLESLPPDRYTIVTSGTRPLATKRLQAAGLPVPLRMITADDVAQGKPHPEPFLAGAKLLGFPAEQCVVFEDAPSGLLAARAAGMLTIALATTYRVGELSRANQVIPNLESVHVIQQPSGELRMTLQNLIAIEEHASA